MVVVGLLSVVLVGFVILVTVILVVHCSRIKIQYYRIALPCKRVRRRWGKSVAEKIFCSVMSCSADLIL